MLSFLKANNASESVEDGSAEQVEDVKLAEEAKDNFSCEICDFRSNLENGLAIHMTKKNSNIEQLDGSSSISEDYDEKEKYSRTIHYWKEGTLGTVFQ